jgi:hypothetical protein
MLKNLLIFTAGAVVGGMFVQHLRDEDQSPALEHTPTGRDPTAEEQPEPATEPD